MCVSICVNKHTYVCYIHTYIYIYMAKSICLIKACMYYVTGIETRQECPVQRLRIV